MPDEVTLFQEIRMEDHKLAYDEQIKNLIFLVIFNFHNALCVYGEYSKQQKSLTKFIYLYSTITAKDSLDYRILPCFVFTSKHAKLVLIVPCVNLHCQQKYLIS
jgi:hypothetical protein